MSRPCDFFFSLKPIPTLANEKGLVWVWGIPTEVKFLAGTWDTACV